MNTDSLNNIKNAIEYLKNAKTNNSKQPITSAISCINDAIKNIESTKYNKNQVPYISTYYIKPIVKPNEDVIIDYYISDWFRKDIVENDFSEVFTVSVRVEGKDEIKIPFLKAGDHSVNIGSFNDLDNEEVHFSIQCTDAYGRNSHELFNFFLVRNDVPVKEYVMTTDDLVTYNISNTNDTTKIVDTREGLQKLLDDKQSEGYNKLKLLEGTYRIDHLAPIYIPTRFTLDMNGATLKLHEFAGNSALMMELNNTFDSHIINGVIEGDYYNHDYTNSPNNSEWVNGISIGGESKYSSYENLIIKDITGYGTINGIKNSPDGKLGYTYLYPRSIGNTFKLGDIDRNTGMDIESTNRTTCDFRDISGYSDLGYLSVSVYLGYQGNPCGTWNLICHFYDESKNFIKSTDAYQYRRVAVPNNAKYMRVTILNESYPTNLSIQLFRIPTNCQFKNLKLDNCRAVGMAPQAMNNLLFENCELTKCGSAVTGCALDAEDGWDMMQDCTFRKLNFHDNPNNDFLTCAGHNFILDNMLNGNVYIWGRTKDLVIKNSNIGKCILGYTSLIRTGYCRLYKNIVNSLSPNENANADNTIIRNSSIGQLQKSTAYNCIITGSIFSNGIAHNCKFINSSGYMQSNIYIYDSIFECSEDKKTLLNFNQSKGIRFFYNCTFKGYTIIKGNYCNSAIFNKCDFDNIDININYANNLGDLQFNDCNIVYYEKVGAIDSGFIKFTANASAQFNNCEITCIPNEKNSKIALVWIRNYVNGSKTIFKNCTIIKTIGYVIDGYYHPSTFKSDTNYEVILDNTPVSIQLISDKYKDYTYYKVTIIN